MNKALLIIGIISALLIGCAQQTPTGNTVVEDKAPDFSVTSVNGKDISLAQSIEDNKPTVVYFMASWCPKCAKNWKGINQAYPTYQDNVNLVAISIDPTDDEETIKKLAKEKGFLFEAVPGNPAVAKAFGVTQQTTKFAIDAAGNIVDRHEGVLSPEEWDAFFAQVV